MAPKVVLYGTRFCPYCIAARRLLTRKGVPFDDISVDTDRALRREVMERSGRPTVPQIWIGATHIGGYDDMSELDRRGELDPLLRGEK